MADPANLERIVADVEATGADHIVTRDGRNVAAIVNYARYRAMLANGPTCERCGQPVDEASGVKDDAPWRLRPAYRHQDDDPACEPGKD
jgi:hypothetical protein